MGKPRRILLQNLWITGFLLFCPPLEAAEITPFYTRNQSPLVQVFGLPPVGEAKILPPRKGAVTAVLDYSSHFAEDSNPRENILLDGETARVTLDFRLGIVRGLEAGAAVPYIIQGGGFLDGFIIDYHNAFGFPQGGREEAPRNRLLYRYARDGQTRLRLDRSGEGLGDIQLFGGFQLWQSAAKPSRGAALRAALKLPTGNSGELHGSGSTDLALWLAGADDASLPIGRFAVFGGAGVLGMTRGDVLPDQQRSAAAFGSLGAGWSPARWIAFKVQADGHTSFFRKSALREVNGASVQLTIGGTLAFTEKVRLDLGVTEDLIVKTAPDAVFHLALRVGL